MTYRIVLFLCLVGETKTLGPIQLSVFITTQLIMKHANETHTIAKIDIIINYLNSQCINSYSAFLLFS